MVNDFRHPVATKRLFTVPEAAEYLGRSENAVKLLIHRGKLPVTRIDSKSQIDKKALDKLIDKCTYFESDHRTLQLHCNYICWGSWLANANTEPSINETRFGGSSTTRKGQPVYESSRSVRADDAERLLRKRLGEVATGAFRGIAVERTTLDELFDLVVADYRENGKRSIDDVLSRLKLHLRPRLGKSRAADFGSADIRRYKAYRKNEKAEAATINRELSILKRAFSLGSRHDPPLVLHNPPVEKIPENNIRTGFLEKADYGRLLAELPLYLKPALVIAYTLVSCKMSLKRGLDSHTR